MTRTLKSMDVSPVLALVVADYLIAECDMVKPTEDDIVGAIETGVSEYGSASGLMTHLYNHFGSDYVPGRYVRAVAEHERLHAENDAKRDRDLKALNEPATVEYYTRRGCTHIRVIRLGQAIELIQSCNKYRSITVWF